MKVPADIRKKYPVTDADTAAFLDLFDEPVGRVLEIGAHDEPVANMLADCGFDVTGVDLRPYDANQALDTPQEPIPCNYRFIQHDFCDTSDAWVAEHQGRYDCVVALSCIEHFGLGTYGEQDVGHKPDLDAFAMRMAWLYLKPGGVCYVSVPLGGEFLVYGPHWRIYDEAALRERIVGDFEVVTACAFVADEVVINGVRKNCGSPLTVEEIRAHKGNPPHISTLLKLRKADAMNGFVIEPHERVIELGGGDNPFPQTHVNVDARKGPRTDFTADFDEPLPITTGEWDVVLSKFVIEHLSWRKVRQFVSEVKRILKPGGRCLIITANTEAQFRWIADHPDGWDGKPLFESAGCILFGDQDYPENTHKNYVTPELLHRVFEEAGFADIATGAWGERATDMVLTARNPVETNTPQQEEPNPVMTADQIAATPPDRLYDKHYFNGGGKVGGYGMYADFPVHHLVAANVLAKKPESVLELGCGRGYVLKRVQDAGVPGWGVDVSRHCYMTRVCGNITCADATALGLPHDFLADLCYSVAFLDHVPESRLPALLAFVQKYSRRGLHGVDCGPANDSDRTRCTIRPVAWWRQKFDEHGLRTHEVVDKAELERGQIDPAVLQGDGLVKLNLGSHSVMFHHGWDNADILDLSQFAQQNGYRFRRLDARQGLPYGTQTVDAVYSSHMLEHLTYDEGLRLLRELRRVVKPTGVVRVAVPDAELLLGCKDLDQFAEINDEIRPSMTRARKLHALLCQNHLATYDAATLVGLFEQAGFRARQSGFRQHETDLTSHGDAFRRLARETHDMFPCLSLYVDAVPAT